MADDSQVKPTHNLNELTDNDKPHMSSEPELKNISTNIADPSEESTDCSRDEKPIKPKRNVSPLSEAEKQLHAICDKGPDDAGVVTKLLKTANVRTECANEHNITPLMSAAYRGFYNITKALVDAGADVNTNAHDDFYTPLHFAGLSGKINVVKLLLEHGAKTTVVNGMGKTAADLAGFVGHRACSSLISNYCSRDVLEYYTKPHGFEREPKLPAQLLNDMQVLVTLQTVHPVKVLNTLQQHPQLLAHAPAILSLLNTLITKQIKEHAGDEMSEKLAVKLHVYACVLRYASVDNEKSRRSLAELKKALIVGAEPQGDMAELERFLRSCLGSFPYPESLLLRVCVKALIHSTQLNNTTALFALNQGVFGLMSKDGDEMDCCVCGGVQKNAKQCGNCHWVTYCSRECQHLHWFTHKKFCQKLKDKSTADASEYERNRQQQQEREKRKAIEQQMIASSQPPSVMEEDDN